MNRKKIKQQAREMIKGNIWNILQPYLIICGISLVVGMISSAGMATDEPSMGASLVAFLLELAMYPLTFGALVYLVKFVRKEPYELKELFAHYNKFWPIFALSFLTGLFTILWSFLFIIPGIIAAISYSMAMLIMVDGDEDAMSCIKKSKAMMNGYKWDYFKFGFSFFWWYLLGIITLGIAFIYVGPYVMVSEVLYYEELKKINPSETK